MPNYDYKCYECDHAFEVFQKMSDAPLKKCPKCNGKVKRLIGTGSGPIFKGTGFYQTDYKANSSNKKSDKPIETKKVDPPKTTESTSDGKK
ncbi:MAG: zinc ribbon domain-containing protein [Ignavibacteria bacterium]|nr:zinc ribbon domain-containing protein [Ignavibacteria bacterium]MDP3831429.1 zinc ribbon domain-containing protein [Ignavibacteriaceae bacterium]